MNTHATPAASPVLEAVKTPPHDLLAEQSTLGGMLISPDAVADVIEVLRGADFYQPKHELIFDAVLTLYSHGEPTDVIAVCDQLLKHSQLERAGGADYLHSLTSHVPTAANAGFYASIVADKATLRRLVNAGHESRRQATQPKAKSLTWSTPPKQRSTRSPGRPQPTPPPP